MQYSPGQGIFMQAIIKKLFFARFSLSDFSIHTFSYLGLILLKDAAYAVIFFDSTKLRILKTRSKEGLPILSFDCFRKLS